MLDTEDGSEVYVEVKSVTMAERLPATSVPAAEHVAAPPDLVTQHAAHDKIALFPDTVSVRAQRHVRELMQVVADGKQAAVGGCWHLHAIA